MAGVSGPVPYAPRLGRRSGACPSVRLPLAMVAALGAAFRVGVECRRGPGRSKRDEDMREPMEGGQSGGNDRRPILAAVSGAMPPPGLGRRPAFRGFCCCSRSCACARHPVRLSVSLVAAVDARFDAGVECWRGPAGGPIHDRTRSPDPLPHRRRRMGQHADRHLPLFGNALLWADSQGCLYVRGRRARRRLSRRAEPPT
jgi:hypothetical protein